MDLRLIEHLALVADRESISKAAAKLGIAQPALGRQMEKLEQECGVRLLYRHGRGVSLTPEGERFLDGARPLLREMGALVEDVRTDGQNPHGVVTVGLTPTMLDLFGLRLVRSVREKYPQIRLDIRSNYSGYVHEWLTAGTIDIGLLHDDRRSKHVSVEHLATADLYLVSASRQLNETEREATAIDLRQLATLDLALSSKTHGLRKTLEAAARRAGVSLRVAYEIDALPLLKDLVLCGDAHTVLAMPSVKAEVIRGELVARKLRRPAVDTKLVLGTAVHRPYTSAVRAVRSAVANSLRDAVESSPTACGIWMAAMLLPVGRLPIKALDR